MSCIDASVRIVTKSPKVDLYLYSPSLCFRQISESFHLKVRTVPGKLEDPGELEDPEDLEDSLDLVVPVVLLCHMLPLQALKNRGIKFHDPNLCSSEQKITQTRRILLLTLVLVHPPPSLSAFSVIMATSLSSL
jgi:hypothetical protein